jgi:CheY-like chemotaxis protein
MTHVLLVEDDAIVRYLWRLVLEEADYQVAEARNGREALGTLRAEAHPFVVLLGPLGDTDEVLAAAVQDHWLARRHAFIVVTDTCSPVLRECLIPLHALVLGTPVELESLLALVAIASARTTDGAVPNAEVG